MTISLPTAEIKSALNSALQSALNTEQQLGADAQAQLRQLIDDLYPLVTAQTQALLTASNPAVPQTYLALLQGCVDASVAKMGLHAINQQRQLVASAIQTAIHILALVLRAAVV